jgi:sulfite reductase (ferredoxin)
MSVVIKQDLDNIVKKDILALNDKIEEFVSGKVSDEKFRAYRLARGVYGQRQLGVQMIRIKLPYGRLNSEQLIRIADVCDEYASGILHATTRQDIQIHHVKLKDTPQLWAKLEEKNITLREACGNTVRNVTGSADAGINPNELFDITPYAHALFEYFLRNPICQEMGRKFKVAFSSDESDNAFTFIHDLGFIPKIKDGQRGFKVMVGGGLGAQPFHAHVYADFVHVDDFIPFSEAVIRVFDRFGERTRRHKARLKYLINDLGFEAFLNLVEEERLALKNNKYVVDTTNAPETAVPIEKAVPTFFIADDKKYQNWLKTNVQPQKQAGFFSINVKLPLGNMDTDTARKLAAIVAEGYSADELRITVNQGYLIKFVREDYLGHFFQELDKLGLAEPGAESTADIAACPGTETCNLGIASSYGLAEELEKVIREEYPDLIFNNHIKIKISGCMNACGQHSLANIGFHGMSMKAGGKVLPAMQLLLGGGVKGDGLGLMSDKVVKIPSKRVPDALRALLNDYQTNGLEGEYFNDYFYRQGNPYFYNMLKPLAATDNITPDYFVDWGNTDQYETAVGVGECAGVMLDLVATLLNDTKEKLQNAKETFEEGAWADSIYWSYAVFVSGAKALLTSKDVNCNTQHGIINDFDTHFVQTGLAEGIADFKAHVLRINKNEPSEAFAKQYLADAEKFFVLLETIKDSRTELVQEN